MSYDEKTGQVDWKDESVWITISLGSGVILAVVYRFFQLFPETALLKIVALCCLGFYLLSVLLRIQNHRGESITGKTSINEKRLKFIFPVVGFAVGLATIFL